MRRVRDFNPRSPRGERLSKSSSSLQSAVFQSTLPAGGATTLPRIEYYKLEISIHAPRGGSDDDHPPKRQGRQNFNPRSPRGERRKTLTKSRRHMDFNPRSPRGERRLLGNICRPTVSFQSTLPAGGATRNRRQRKPIRGISIHAPRGGSDVGRENIYEKIQISIHAPRGGSDGLAVGPTMAMIGISIHAPRGGSDSKSACFLCENLSIYHKFCTQIFLKAFPPLLST